MSKVRLGRIVLMFLVLVCSLAIVACGSEEGSQEKSDTLAIALPSEPENLNPIFGDTLYDGNWRFFNGLLRYGQNVDEEPVSEEPDLAAAMPETSSDGLTVTVPLRDDALIPFVTLIGTHLSELIGGTVLIESIFGWPGLGLLTRDAALNVDLPLLVAITLASSVLVVLGNLLADLLYHVLDPRVRETLT